MAFLETHNLTVIRKRGMLPRIPFLRIKEALLGKNYALTIAFVSGEETEALNKKYRNKDYKANILSFPLSENEGEIYIALAIARTQAKDFGLSYRAYLHLLIIHGCLHLKGCDHGSTMEEEERSLLKRYYKE